MVDNSTKRGSSESVPIPAADFGIEKATEIPSLPDFSEKRKIDIKYPLIKPYAYAHIHWDEDQKEVVYELKEPPLNLKEKHVLKELEKGLEELINIIRERKNSSSDKSYTNKLLSNADICTDKLNEEINELLEAIKKNSNKVHEAADVIYHLMVFLEANGIKIENVMDELKKRQK